ncbi:MAG: TIGR03761 family integrating conjugative element protein [Gammaproteobacteria bacterium]|nr:TIGR03761 family integrating conjugative element protein [Gammaproteobacteria bacterium]
MSEATTALKKELEQGVSTSFSVDTDFDFDDDEKPVRHPTHEDNADPIVPPKQVSVRPGRMRTQGEIVLHTRAAHRLFYGRRRDDENKIKPIIGLVRFSTNINGIFECAANNDPYADLVLLKIENQFSAANTLASKNIKALEQLLGDMGGLTICNNESVSPITLPVEFKTVYGFIGARLLSQYDKLVRLGLVANHVGLLFADDWNNLVGKMGSKIREVFWLSTQYRYTGVTRDDVATNNEVARRAATKYGELPQDVMEGTRRAQHAPVIRVSSALADASSQAAH